MRVCRCATRLPHDASHARPSRSFSFCSPPRPPARRPPTAIPTACRRADRSTGSACPRRPTTTACSSSGRTGSRTRARRSPFPKTSCASAPSASIRSSPRSASASPPTATARPAWRSCRGRTTSSIWSTSTPRRRGSRRRSTSSGASEGGIITALSLEQHPEVYSAGVAACGPIGDFPFQINYFGDARATFEVFFPGLIPGTAFTPDPGVVADWTNYYDTHREARRVRAGQPQQARSVGRRSRTCRSTPPTTSTPSRCRCRTCCATAS